MGASFTSVDTAMAGRSQTLDHSPSNDHLQQQPVPSQLPHAEARPHHLQVSTPPPRPMPGYGGTLSSYATLPPEPGSPGISSAMAAMVRAVQCFRMLVADDFSFLSWWCL